MTGIEMGSAVVAKTTAVERSGKLVDIDMVRKKALLSFFVNERKYERWFHFHQLTRVEDLVTAL